MTNEVGPVCGRHEREVPMRLRTIHSEAVRPTQVMGLFECPECGYERRLPLQSEAGS